MFYEYFMLRTHKFSECFTEHTSAFKSWLENRLTKNTLFWFYFNCLRKQYFFSLCHSNNMLTYCVCIQVDILNRHSILYHININNFRINIKHYMTLGLQTFCILTRHLTTYSIIYDNDNLSILVRKKSLYHLIHCML